jgi:predicted ATPase
VYFVGKERRNDFDAVFHALTKDSSVVSTSLQTQGRLVPIPRAAVSKGVARFSFEDLCTKALGAADYLVIGQNFHTVFVEGVPKLNRNEINWVRRFIIFVDAMYESHVKLILQAQTQPEGIFQVDLEDDSCDEVFAFDRTRSRLEEMRSESYLRRRWIGGTVQKDAAKAKLRVEPSLSQNIVPH